jgi:hypothetical protein
MVMKLESIGLVFREPQICPLDCGGKLDVRKIGWRTKRFLEETRQDSDKIDFERTFGILCQNCGYATIVVRFKT